LRSDLVTLFTSTFAFSGTFSVRVSTFGVSVIATFGVLVLFTLLVAGDLGAVVEVLRVLRLRGVAGTDAVDLTGINAFLVDYPLIIRANGLTCLPTHRNRNKLK
tara:strand:- start:2420 stop:2731 length:312 start_codon:yes stop_codon:yes gene_type:complete